MSKLYALLVGINEYAPDSKIRPLLGCINDVSRMEKWIRQNFIDPEVLALHNQSATRASIIKALKGFSSSVPPDTTFLFHFAGHGSTAPCAPEFAASNPMDQDETLICYDSRLTGGFDLADKEIGALLAKFNPGVDIVLIFDSCHSGSASRAAAEEDTDDGVRYQPGLKTPRELKDYLNGYYVGKETHGASLEVPRTPHILLAACQANQKAAETSTRDHGAFSKALLDVLEANVGKINYRQLFSKVKLSICSFISEQTPQFDVYEGFNANRVFLERTVINENQFFTYFDTTEGHWQVNLGAIHGLPSDSTGINLLLHSENQATPQPIPAAITEVRMNYSVISANGVLPGQTFGAEITGLTTPLLQVWLSGGSDLQQNFVQLVSKTSPFYEFVNAPETARYELRLSDSQMVIYHLGSGKLIHGVRGFDQMTVSYIIGVLSKIEYWERVSNLNHDGASGLTRSVETWFEEADDQGVMHRRPGREVQLNYSNGQKISGRILVSNHSTTKLYVALVSLSRKFQIASKLPDQQELPPGKQDMQLLSDLYSIGDDEVQEATDLYKIIFSKKPIDNTLFSQPRIGLGQIVDISSNSMSETVSFRDADSDDQEEKEDWFVHTLALRISRNSGSLENGLKRGILDITAHPSLKAKVRFVGHNSYTRGFSDTQLLENRLAEHGLELLPLNPFSRDAGTEDLVQLTDLEDVPADGVLSSPLKMSLPADMLAGDKVFPIAFDGEFIVPFGEVRYDLDSVAHVEVNQLPIPGEDPGKRGFGRALWFGFLRVALKAEKSIFLLREIYFDGKKVRYNQEDIAGKVKNASNILLVIHGIIGNTKDKAEAVRFAYLPSRYDLVLAFDYENLNTPIPKIAEILNKTLTDAGLGPDDGKKLTIVAHSMGGLVSRYLIEKIRINESLVDALYLFGTPNGGSRFGKIPDILRLSQFLLGIAINISGGPVTEVMEWIKCILGVAPDHALVTLEMMEAESEFLKGLAQCPRPPHTRYFVVAGNIRAINAADTEGFFNRLVERLLVGTGKMVYYNMDSDIAVSVESVLDIPFLDPATESTVIAAHHLNYFTSEAGRGVLIEKL